MRVKLETGQRRAKINPYSAIRNPQSAIGCVAVGLF